MRCLKPAGLAALIALAAAPVLADDGDFPATDDAASVASWLGARTNIKPASVVTVTPGFVIALVAKQKALSPEGPVRVTLREEVIAPAFVESVGGRSALISAQIQCEERRLRMDGRDLYAGPNLSGRKSVDGPSTEWLRIPEDTVMDEVAAAACDDHFEWPLQPYSAAAPVIAEQSASPPAQPPAAEPTPPLLPAAAPPVEAPPVVEQAKAEEPSGPPTPPAATIIAEQSVPPPAQPPAGEPAPPPALEPVALPVAATTLPAEASPVIEQAKAEEPSEPTKPSVRYAIQIGAYRNQALAQTAWKALSTQRPVVTKGHSFDVRPVKVKGKELLRGLVMNFNSPKDGAAFCAALVGSGYGCILRTLAD